MPSEDIQTFQAASGYKFSGMSIDALGSSQYTLVGLVVDVSGSVDPFAKALEQMLKTVYKGCNDQNNAYRENLMFRVTVFNHTIKEIHGFKTLNNINENDYNGSVACGGDTALCDAVDEMVQALTAYGATLTKQDFTVNGMICVVTDGRDNASNTPMGNVAKSVKKIRLSEAMTSCVTILVGVTNDDNNLDHYLQTFKDDAGMDQYVSIGKATPGKVAKLAGFISQSVSSTSSALNQGTPSKPITPPTF